MRRPTLLAPLLVCALLLATPGASGCSSKRKTETITETIEYPAGATLPDGQVAQRDTQVQVTRERTTVTDEESGCGGVLSCTGKVAWEIVKLPFRIVGFVLDVLI